MKEKKGEHPFGDTGQLILLLLYLAVWVADSFFFRKTTFFAEHVPLSIRLFLMMCFLVLSYLLVRSGHVVLRGDERPGEIVSTGAFRYVRHPLYLGCILFYLGLTVSTLSLVSLALLVPIALFYNFLGSYEEKLLQEKFGDPYRDYMEITGRWIPRIGNR